MKQRQWATISSDDMALKQECSTQTAARRLLGFYVNPTELWNAEPVMPFGRKTR